MRIWQGVRTGLGHGGITCVLQTQFSSGFFLQFCIPRWLSSAATKNNTKHEMDNISITAEWILIKIVSK